MTISPVYPLRPAFSKTAGEIFVPSDCVAALRKADQHKALALMRKSFQADARNSTLLELKKLRFLNEATSTFQNGFC
jgi:hypothetical protein